MRVFLSAGEASGDAYAAALVREMRRLTDEPLEFEGVGGRLMRAEGVNLVADSTSWGAIGVIEAARMLPRVSAQMPTVLAKLRSGPPGVLIPIDFGFVNIRLARAAKEAGWKVLYFIPPSSWRRNRQGRDLPQITDAISTPFPWSAEILNRMGANAHWFGHPIRQLLAESGPVTTTVRDSIAVLPGSRRQKIAQHLPLAARALMGRTEVIDFIAAPNIGVERLQAAWRQLAPERRDRFTVADKYVALRRAKVAMVCSGTATLDAALSDCPMVVVWKTSIFNHLVGFAMGLSGKSIGLPNILLDERIVPEHVGAFVTGQELSTALDQVLADPQPQLEAFDRLRDLLGPEDAITKTAELALSLG